jgi:hypothetical protein
MNNSFRTLSHVTTFHLLHLQREQILILNAFAERNTNNVIQKQETMDVNDIRMYKCQASGNQTMMRKENAKTAVTDELLFPLLVLLLLSQRNNTSEGMDAVASNPPFTHTQRSIDKFPSRCKKRGCSSIVTLHFPFLPSHIPH